MSSEVSKSLTNLRAARSAATPASSSRPLTAPEFHQLGKVLPATEWFANVDNPNTRRAYRNDLQEFMTFVGISIPDELRLVTRPHVLAWRQDLERLALTGSTVRRKLAAPAPRRDQRARAREHRDHQLYDRRKSRPEDSPTFKVAY